MNYSKLIEQFNLNFCMVQTSNSILVIYFTRFDLIDLSEAIKKWRVYVYWQ